MDYKNNREDSPKYYEQEFSIGFSFGDLEEDCDYGNKEDYDYDQKEDCDYGKKEDYDFGGNEDCEVYGKDDYEYGKKEDCCREMMEEAFKEGFEKGKEKGFEKGCKVGYEKAKYQLFEYMKKNKCCLKCRKRHCRKTCSCKKHFC